MPIDMRRTTQTHGSGTTTASTMTLRGLIATAGVGATLLAALAAPVLTVTTIAGVIAAVSLAALFRSVRPADERTETDDQRRMLHRLLTEVARAT